MKQLLLKRTRQFKAGRERGVHKAVRESAREGCEERESALS